MKLKFLISLLITIAGSFQLHACLRQTSDYHFWIKNGVQDQKTNQAFLNAILTNKPSPIQFFTYNNVDSTYASTIPATVRIESAIATRAVSFTQIHDLIFRQWIMEQDPTFATTREIYPGTNPSQNSCIRAQSEPLMRHALSVKVTSIDNQCTHVIDLIKQLTTLGGSPVEQYKTLTQLLKTTIEHPTLKRLFSHELQGIFQKSFNATRGFVPLNNNELAHIKKNVIPRLQEFFSEWKDKADFFTAILVDPDYRFKGMAQNFRDLLPSSLNSRCNDLLSFDTLCGQGNFEQAWQLVEKYQQLQRITKADWLNAQSAQDIRNHAHILSYFYDQRFSQKYTAHGIEHTYILDPELQKHQLEPTHLPNPLNAELKIRYLGHHEILARYHVANPTPQAVQLAYQLIDAAPDKHLGLIVENVALDLDADTYKQFCTADGITRNLLRDQNLFDGITIPEALHTQAYTPERLILNRIVEQAQKLPQCKPFSQVAIQYIAHACQFPQQRIACTDAAKGIYAVIDSLSANQNGSPGTCSLTTHQYDQFYRFAKQFESSGRDSSIIIKHTIPDSVIQTLNKAGYSTEHLRKSEGGLMDHCMHAALTQYACNTKLFDKQEYDTFRAKQVDAVNALWYRASQTKTYGDLWMREYKNLAVNVCLTFAENILTGFEHGIKYTIENPIETTGIILASHLGGTPVALGMLASYLYSTFDKLSNCKSLEQFTKISGQVVGEFGSGIALNKAISAFNTILEKGASMSDSFFQGGGGVKQLATPEGIGLPLTEITPEPIALSEIADTRNLPKFRPVGTEKTKSAQETNQNISQQEYTAVQARVAKIEQLSSTVERMVELKKLYTETVNDSLRLKISAHLETELVAYKKELSNKYGSEILDEFSKYWNLDAITLIKMLDNEMQLSFQKTDILIQDLKKIICVEGRKDFLKEVDKTASLNTIYEARAAIICEETGAIKKLTRSPARGCDFIEIHDSGIVEWDIKTAQQHSMYGKPIYNEKQFVNNINDTLKYRSYNLIIDMSDLELQNKNSLSTWIKEINKEHSRRIILIENNLKTVSL